MAVITISKREYERLAERARRYEYIRQIISADIFAPPPTQDVKEVIESFKKTGKYNRKFLKSLEKGLKRSFYFSSQV